MNQPKAIPSPNLKKPTLKKFHLKQTSYAFLYLYIEIKNKKNILSVFYMLLKINFTI